MIIIRLIGGLGNQMFQYALYRSLKANGKEVKLDISGFNHYGLHNGYELENLFFIEPMYSSNEENNILLKSKKSLLNKIKKKFIGRYVKYYIQEEFRYLPKIMEFNNVYLDGYWQSELYFKPIENIIRNEFVFKAGLDSKNIKVLDEIKNTNSVSIHFRRGDYEENAQSKAVHGGITTLNYYENAVNIIQENVNNPTFFIFSDDIDWVKENFKISNSHFIDWNKEKESYKDMQLMSNCKHNIIANSSFSWWGAWLNNNEEKTVVAPGKWFNNINAMDIIPEGWHIIDLS